ncbi:hypothetical protein [Hymenobacter sp. GOD-10R]|uniref:hypothetical protein n=1 Tax=Hymenobacter sp. GOD-10R TaxID=3093922 RepID=UPI002D799C9F|nr:hypothetical protein [Hymenobacter sp. GOD-10R]WRQ27565.1 hypothetical protein SD425_21070 [Hymenobacter sp. GOD-10R]
MEQELYQDKYRTQSIRLAGYDYGQNGAYFITICTSNRAKSFGEIIIPNQDWDQAYLRSTELGIVVQEC